MSIRIEGNYWAYPVELSEYDLVSESAKVLYVFLLNQANYVLEPRQYTNAWLGRQLGMQFPKIARLLGELAKAELIRQTGRGDRRRVLIVPHEWLDNTLEPKPLPKEIYSGYR